MTDEIEITWWTGMMMASAVILFAIVGVHKLHEWGYFARRNIWGVIWLNGKLYSIR